MDGFNGKRDLCWFWALVLFGPRLSPLGDPTQVQSGYFCYWSVLNLMVPPWTQIIIHTRETGTDNPPWKQFLAAAPSSGLLLALATDRENAGYTRTLHLLPPSDMEL